MGLWSMRSAPSGMPRLFRRGNPESGSMGFCFCNNPASIHKILALKNHSGAAEWVCGRCVAPPLGCRAYFGAAIPRSAVIVRSEIYVPVPSDAFFVAKQSYSKIFYSINILFVETSDTKPCRVFINFEYFKGRAVDKSFCQSID